VRLEESLSASKLRSCQASQHSGFGLLLKVPGNRVNLLGNATFKDMTK